MAEMLVYGSLEFGRVVKDLVGQCGHRFAGYIDDYNGGDEVLGGLAHVVEHFPPDRYQVAIAVGYRDLSARWNVYQTVRSKGYGVPALVHPRAYVRDAGSVGDGALIMAGSVVDVHAVIASLVVIWPGAVVNHDSVVHENTFLSPNSTVCGCAIVGRATFVGAGATIVDHVEVPPGSFIKANAVFGGRTAASPDPADR